MNVRPAVESCMKWISRSFQHTFRLSHFCAHNLQTKGEVSRGDSYPLCQGIPFGLCCPLNLVPYSEPGVPRQRHIQFLVPYDLQYRSTNLGETYRVYKNTW